MTSTMAVSHDATMWAARQVVRMHTETATVVQADDPATHDLRPYPTHRANGRCAQCTPTGCRLLVWARAELAAALGVTPPPAG